MYGIKGIFINLSNKKFFLNIYNKKYNLNKLQLPYFHKENLEWFYIEQEAPSLLGAIYGSNKWCVVCDASIADEDVLEWLKANAYGGRGPDPSWANGESWEVDEDGLLPCLFANTNGDSAAECQSAICQGDVREVFNDIVWPDYGAAKIIAPLLER